MVAETIPQLKKLTRAKKQQLIEELINEVYGQPVEEPELITALEARLEHFRKHPESARVWEGGEKERARRRK